MKNILLAALPLLLLPCFGAAGAEAPRKATDANLFGHVVDRTTHEHLAYATVSVVGTTFGTTTDPDFSHTYETGLMITIADLFEAKRKRYIDPYLDYLAMLLEERKLARQNRLLDKVKLRKRFTIKIR